MHMDLLDPFGVFFRVSFWDVLALRTTCFWDGQNRATVHHVAAAGPWTLHLPDGLRSSLPSG